MLPTDYKYYAFISYNSKDTEWGKRVQQKLEHYRMPATLCSEHGWTRTPIKPVFFAPTDIQPGELTEELQERLRASKNLIVICSPNSAQSEWVGKEIEFFHQLGRSKQMHFFIVNGAPHSGNPNTECFNPIITKLGIPEILGANIHEHIYRWPWLNKERAYIQLISKLLDVEFDTIWQRHKRLLIQKVVTWTISIIALLIMWVFTIKSIIPFTMTIQLDEKSVTNNYLPSYTGGVTTLYLGDEILTDTVDEKKQESVFDRIPKRFHNQLVRITFAHPDFMPVDTLLPLTENNSLLIHRNPDVYGHLHFRLWDVQKEEIIPHYQICISNKTDLSQIETFSDVTQSNDSGVVDLHIPLEHQRTAYSIYPNNSQESSIFIMPCGEDDVILIK